jgi:hypothetical protein
MCNLIYVHIYIYIQKQDVYESFTESAQVKNSSPEVKCLFDLWNPKRASSSDNNNDENDEDKMEEFSISYATSDLAHVKTPPPRSLIDSYTKKENARKRAEELQRAENEAQHALVASKVATTRANIDKRRMENKRKKEAKEKKEQAKKSKQSAQDAKRNKKSKKKGGKHGSKLTEGEEGEDEKLKAADGDEEENDGEEEDSEDDLMLDDDELDYKESDEEEEENLVRNGRESKLLLI